MRPIFLLLSFPFLATAQTPVLEWAGKGPYRVVARVEARKIAGAFDEMPAELALDFQATLAEWGLTRRVVDVASIQVVAHDPLTGKARGPGNDAHGKGPLDRAFRWYDDAIPYEFPEFNDAVSRTNGKIVWRTRTRGGHYYHVLGDWRKGKLVWSHRQANDHPTLYGIYFDLLPEGQTPSRLPPQGWVGDGSARFDKVAISTTGSGHARVDVDDWDGDGLVDLIVGEQTGRVLWWPNVGTKTKPEFRFARFVEADGKPLDAGQAAAPKIVDWDGDGVKDLLVGTHWNRLLFYRNAGTNEARKLTYQWVVMVDGQPLELPFAPLERGSADIFKRDYYPVPECADWNGDGKLDLLLGGYVTGRIFLFEQTGRAEDRTLLLKARGPIDADGKPLNVKYWGAAPCLVDLDGDGDLDLLAGNFPMYERAEQTEANHDFLQYFENIGTRTEPKLVRRPFPGEGMPPRERLATPRAVDWDGDGDLDLVVSAGGNVFLIENAGTKTKPLFRLHTKPIEVAWGHAPLVADRFFDWNGDGKIDLIRDYTVRLNEGVGSPYRFAPALSVLPRGAHIAHPSKIGDDWYWPYLYDFDGDGRPDVVFGDWWGHVWLHRNLSTKDEKKFDLEGARLKLASGALIKVGPIGKDPAKNFDALQGARTVLTAADFDKDGACDLVLGDTYGKVRYFRHVKGTSPPAFAEPIEIGDLGIRGLVESADWNRDGWPDVIASSAAGKVRVFLNQGTKPGPRFGKGFDPGLPPIMQPRVLVADLNGDGDDDLFLQSTQGACFVERSFLEHGYAPAAKIAAQRK